MICSHNDCISEVDPWSELQLIGTTFPQGVRINPSTPWMLDRSLCVALKLVIDPGYPSRVALEDEPPSPGFTASHT
jgi:hypothetical protein